MSIDEIIELANKHGYTGGDTELRLAIQAYANSERDIEYPNKWVFDSYRYTQSLSKGGSYSTTSDDYVTGYRRAVADIKRLNKAQLSNTQVERSK